MSSTTEKRIRACLALVTIPLLALPAGAQDGTDTPALHTVTASGRGEVEVRPDIAFVSFSTVTEADDAAAAMRENTTQMQTLIDTLLATNVAERDIETESVRLDPIYAEPESPPRTRPAAEGTIAGYRAVNTVEVRVPDLRAVGRLIDAAVGAGANQVQNIRFEVSDTARHLDEAREAAWRDAQSKAEQLARLAGATLGSAVEIQATDQHVPLYRQELSAAAADGARVPIQPGTETLSASLQVRWRLEAGNGASPGRGDTPDRDASPGDRAPRSGESPGGSTSGAGSERADVPRDLIDRVKDHVSFEIGVAAEALRVVSAERVEWSDAALGCPESGRMYAQVITPGYRLVLEAQGERYEVHTSMPPDATIVRCDGEDRAR